jgi:hypothetical protein
MEEQSVLRYIDDFALSMSYEFAPPPPLPRQQDLPVFLCVQCPNL